MVRIKILLTLLVVVLVGGFIAFNWPKHEVAQETPPAETVTEATTTESVPPKETPKQEPKEEPTIIINETLPPATVVVPAPQPIQPVIINVQPQPVQQPQQEEPVVADPPEEQHVVETRYTLTLPAGSPVNQPKDRMTLEELQFFTANLFKPHDSPYSKLLKASEEELFDFLQSNGYKILKEKI